MQTIPIVAGASGPTEYNGQENGNRETRRDPRRGGKEGRAPLLPQSEGHGAGSADETLSLTRL